MIAGCLWIPNGLGLSHSATFDYTGAALAFNPAFGLHQMLRRSPIKRTSGLKRGGNLKRTSLKRKTPMPPSMGMSYGAYLKSRLWAAIRFRIFRRDGFKCRCCGSPKRIQCHHRSYELSVMMGRDDAKLLTACRACHRLIEFRVFVKEGDRGNVRRRPADREKVLVELLEKSS